ncbi:MAG: hypothetical protein KOO60_04705 [Gemmatimonadales bacterium]|nr:hypothetical protein [Gemmatimonadales bacterium]
MNRQTLGKTTLVLIILVGALGTTGALAQTTQPVNYQWTAPTTGAPVVHYVIEQSINLGDWTSIGTSANNTFTLTATVGESHRIRVAGVDADSRQGIFSIASEPFVPTLDPPGQPGQPIIF